MTSLPHDVVEVRANSIGGDKDGLASCFAPAICKDVGCRLPSRVVINADPQCLDTRQHGEGSDSGGAYEGPNWAASELGDVLQREGSFYAFANPQAERHGLVRREL